MIPVTPSTVTPTAVRRRWHPVTAAALLALATLVATAGTVLTRGGAGRIAGVDLLPVGLTHPGDGWLVPLLWLLVGACAGFATSGST